jgi:hypothetical protein
MTTVQPYLYKLMLIDCVLTIINSWYFFINPKIVQTGLSMLHRTSVLTISGQPHFRGCDLNSFYHFVTASHRRYCSIEWTQYAACLTLPSSKHIPHFEADVGRSPVQDDVYSYIFPSRLSILPELPTSSSKRLIFHGESTVRSPAPR